jgi:hypothetical protein
LPRLVDGGSHGHTSLSFPSTATYIKHCLI